MPFVPLRAYGFAVLSAALQLLPFPLAGPVPLWRRLFCWICLVPLLEVLLGLRRERNQLNVAGAALASYVCGIAWFGGNCYWIYQTMFLYGGLPGPVAAGILILFSMYLGLYFALFGVCITLIRQWKGTGAALVCAPPVWVAVELARARITGFPWDLLGYTQVDSRWLTRLAPWTGVMGLSLVVAAVNAAWLLPRFFRQRVRWAGPAVALAIVVVSLVPLTRESKRFDATASATLLQDNLGVGTEARGENESQEAMLQDFAGLSLHPVVSEAARIDGLGQRPQVVVWPEAPTTFMSADPRFRAVVGDVARRAQAPVIADAVAVGEKPNAEHRYDEFVSASFFLPDGSYAGRYDKMHLVPFGEYTPYKQLFFFAGHLLDQLVFVPGTQRRLFSVAGRRYGVFMCYESIFGDEVRQFALTGAGALVNLTDDGWYGDTSAPWEHLDMARMRAIENHRWLLRDTNTGLTASIDPEGQIVASMPRHVRGAVVVPFGFDNTLTFYTQHGDWVGWLCAVVSVSVLVGSYLQRRYPYRGSAA